MDGRLKSAPAQLLQMNSIKWIPFEGNFLPYAYLLMQSKDKQSCREAFEKIKDIVSQKNVIFIELNIKISI